MFRLIASMILCVRDDRQVTPLWPKFIISFQIIYLMIFLRFRHSRAVENVLVGLASPYSAVHTYRTRRGLSERDRRTQVC